MEQIESAIELPAGSIHYTACGTGPTLVFVHGVFVNGMLWRNVVPQLASRYRCIVPTLPLGAHTTPMRSTADLSPRGLARLVADFLGALDLHDVTLVGNDTGGAICQLVIAHHPQRIARMVLTNCDAFENFPPPVLRPLYAAAHVPGFCWTLAQLLRLPFLQRLFVASVAYRQPEREIVDAFFAPLRAQRGVRRDLTAVITGVSQRETLAAAERFGSFAGPVLIAWGENDLFFPMRDARRLRDAFAHSSLVTILDSRLFVPEDQPHEFVTAIDEFFAAPAAA